MKTLHKNTVKNEGWYKKVLLTAFLLFIASVFAFAADKSLGVTSSDVDNCIKNYSSINKEIDAMDYNEKGNAREPTKEEVQQRDEILKKYGISGPNRFEKMERIKMYSMQLNYINDPKTKNKKDEIDILRNNMNANDLKVIEPKYKEVMSAYDKYINIDSSFNLDIKNKLNLPSIKKKNKK